MQTTSAEKQVRPMKGRKFGKPRGKTCTWTPELDDILKSAYSRGGLLAARRLCRCHPWGGAGDDPVPPLVPTCPQTFSHGS